MSSEENSNHDTNNSMLTTTNLPPKDLTILMRLAISKNYRQLSSLLETISGELLFHKDYKGRTALDWARISNNQPAIQLISDAMSKELNKIRMNNAGYVISNESLIRSTNKNLTNQLSAALDNLDSAAVLKILLDSQLSREVVEDIENETYFTDFKTAQGDTPLIRAAGGGMHDVVIELLGMGTNINTPNKYGHNPLTWACVCGHAEIVRTLILKGADFTHQTNEKRTCLHYACFYLKSRVVSVLFDVLFEKFSMFRTISHPFTKYDPFRWRKYAEIMENFLMTRDFEDRTAVDLIPTDKTIYDASDAIFQSVHHVADHIRRKSTYVPTNPFEKTDEFEKLVKMGSGIFRDANGKQDEDDDDTKGSESEDGSGSGSGRERDYDHENHSQGLGLTEEHQEQQSGGDFVSIYQDFQSDEGEGEAQDRDGNRDRERGNPFPTNSLEDHSSSISALGESKQTQPSTSGTQYFKSFLNDAYSLKTAQPQAVDIFALQNIFRLVNDRLQEWIHCSEQEYQMTLPVKCWNGCGYQTKFEDMTSHVRDSCSHKPLICGDCSEVHPSYHMKHHLTRECIKRLIACPNTKIGCHELVPFHHLTTHINLRCPYRLAYCRLHCGKQFPVISRDNHEKNHCKKREISCYLCNQLIPSELLTKHMKELCECRKIQCTKGCYEYFNIKDIVHHEEMECIQFCKWNCNEKIGPLQKRILHETMECLNRPVRCGRECGVSGLTARNQEDHERNYCQNATLKCPNHCGSILLRTHLYRHLDSWHGTCPERMVRCPSNLIGWRVLVNNLEEGIAIQYKRVELSAVTQQLTTQTHSYSYLTTDLSSIPSPDCGTYKWCSNGVDLILIRFPNRHIWIPYWTSNILPLRRQIKGLKSSNSSDGCYECQWICYSQLNIHLESQCCNRDVLLGQANPLTELTYGLKENQLVGHHPHHHQSGANNAAEDTDMSVVTTKTQEISLRGTSTPKTATAIATTSTPNDEIDISSNDDTEIFHGTEQLMMSLTSFSGQHGRMKESIHLAEKRHEINEFLVAPPDKITCEFCSNEIEVEKIDWHLKHDCSHVLIRCKYGCGQKISRRNLSDHMENICPKRNITCPKCHEIMWYDELTQHLQQTCPLRLVSCPNQCGIDPLPDQDLTHHLTNSCEKRLYQCECGVSYLFCDRSDHLITSCPKRMGLCPQGCGHLLPRDEIEEHQEFYCQNKHIFQNKLISCPLKCGQRLKRLEVLEHVTYSCVLRLVECPLRCGNTLRKEKLKIHLKICPNRELYCEKGMPTCQFKLHQWFCCDVKSANKGAAGAAAGTRAAGTGEGAAGAAAQTESWSDEPDAMSDDIDDETKIQSLPDLGRTIDTIQPVKGQKFYGSGRLIPVENYASALHRATLQQNKDTTTTDLNSIDSLTYALANESTSVTITDGKILMKDELRLLACPSHGRNLLLYAIRFDELDLLKYIITLTKGDDLDLQDRYGDTPLTLACRLQKIEYVTILIHYGADVNMETFTGKTPLIEATKVNNKEIVEMLITAGAIVKQKTFKHSKSAIEWANILKLEELYLYLDLGSVVQIQMEEIFLAISTGNIKKVTEIVQEGSFFSANNTQLFKDKMEENIVKTRETKEYLFKQTEIMRCIEKEWLELRERYDRDQENEDRSKDVYQRLYQRVAGIHLNISTRFENFDKKIALVSSYDLEEITNIRNPTLATRIALLAYGLLFSILNTTEFEKYQTDIASSQQWWSQIIKSLLNKKETLKKLKTFSWVTFQSPHLLGLGQKIQELYREVLIAKQQEEDPQSRHDGSRGVAGDNEMNQHINKTINDMKFKNENEKKEEEEREREGREEREEREDIAQEDWDSDADEGGEGEWIKGKWVGRVKKKSRWWEVKNQIENGNETSTSSSSIENNEKTQQPRSGYKKKRNNVVKISEALAELEERQRNSQNTANTSTPPMTSSSIDLVGGVGGGPTSDIDGGIDVAPLQIEYSKHIEQTSNSFTLNLPFIDSIILLMKAVSEMIHDITHLSNLNQQVLIARVDYEEKRCIKDISKQKYDTMNSKYQMFQHEINDLIIKLGQYKRKIDQYRERLRIARLCNQVSSSGHTVISWAASNGCYEMVELLLSKGATVGYNEQLLHMSASVIQVTFKLFYYYSNTIKEKKIRKLSQQYEKNEKERILAESKRSSSHLINESDDTSSVNGTTSPQSGKKSVAELINLDENSNNAIGHGIEEIFHLKEHRNSLIFRINRLRRNFRFPIPEAIASGSFEIIERIFERKLLHYNFIGSWVPPSPPPPRPRVHYRLHLQQKKISFIEILKSSKNNFSAGILTKNGWLPRGHPEDPYVESYEVMKLLHENLLEQIQKYRENRQIKRKLILAQKNSKKNQKKMTYAIKTSNFKLCMELAQNDLCSIDYETEDGLTALIVACEENIGGLHHQYLINDDHHPVLAVCYLLDRLEYSPAVNIETKTGNIPLLHACRLGREHVVEALLDRHADVNLQNYEKQSALHISAINGSVRCVKLLLERGGNVELRDVNGKTPYDLALEHGFNDVLTILGQYRGGFLGEITGKRGVINETVGCPSGCGVVLHRHEIKDHLPVCMLRTIPCPLECTDPNIIARDVNIHLQQDCPHRLIECCKCHQMIRIFEFEKHQQKKCPYRLVLCSLGCEQYIEAKELIIHQKNCLFKIMECPEQCGDSYPIIKRLVHMKHHCTHRRIPCPNQCSNLITFHTLTHHLNDICPRRLMTCQWCSNNAIESSQLIQHELHCSYRLAPCTNNCQQLIQLNQLTQHLEHECSYRFIPCHNHCQMKIRCVDMDTHLLNECENRLIFCPSHCMSKLTGVAEERTELLAKHLTHHLLHECQERILSCGLCSIQIKAKDLQYHKNLQCEYRQVECHNTSAGCKKILIYNQREKHERGECKYRYLLCPTGCGTAIIAKKLTHHLNTVCSMKYIPCTLQCGLEIRQGQIGMHLQYECKNRPLRSQTMRYSPSSTQTMTTQSSYSSSGSVHSGRSSRVGMMTSLSGNGLNSPGRSISPGIGEDDEDEASIGSGHSQGKGRSHGKGQGKVQSHGNMAMESPKNNPKRGNGNLIPSLSSASSSSASSLSSSSMSLTAPGRINSNTTTSMVMSGNVNRRTVNDRDPIIGKKRFKKTDSIQSLPPI